VEKSERKRPLGRPRRRWEDNTKINLRNIKLGGIDWIDLAQEMGQLEGYCEHGHVSSGSIKI
jgi:hypothetical protein